MSLSAAQVALGSLQLALITPFFSDAPSDLNLKVLGAMLALGALGTGLAYVGARLDTDFDLIPAQTVRLDDYWLASLNLAFRLRPGLELYGRIENGFDADYQDVVGYDTPGRTVHAGLRVALDR